MRPIPKKLKKDMLEDEAYHSCMRNDYFGDHICRGRITLEHSMIHAGKQVNEKWAIISLCAWAHDVDQYQDGGNLDKSKNQYIALIRATDKDLEKYDRNNWKEKRKLLVRQYGIPKRPSKFDLF